MISGMTRVMGVLLVLISISAFSQSDDCRSLVRQSLDKMKRTSASTKGGVMMEYEVNVKTVENASYTDNIGVAIYGDKIRLASADIMLYQDSKTMVIVQKEANTIFIAQPNSRNFNRNQLDEFIKVNDSLFNSMIVKNCQLDNAVKVAGNVASKNIVFALPAKLQQSSGIHSVSYWLDEKNLLIKKVFIQYNSGNDQQLASIDFDFKKTNYDYVSQPFEGSALGAVMTSKNSLKPEYSGYTLIDKR
jgi:hypothetical protein